MPSDQRLIEQVQNGDPHAFDALFVRYEQPVRVHLTKLVRDDVAVDDLLQEVFLRLWTHAHQYQGHGKLIGWLRRTATNIALNHLRSMRRRRTQSIEYESDSEDEDDGDLMPGWMIDPKSLSPDEAVQKAETHRRLWSLVDSLPDHQREVIRMVHEMELDIREIAETLGIPEGTVKSRLHYARSRLAEALEQSEER